MTAPGTEHERSPNPSRRRHTEGPPTWAVASVVAMCLAFAAQFSIWQVHRYDNFIARRFDLGNMVQAVWSAAHGDLMLTTTDQFGEQISRYAGHVEPLLILFAPLWWVWPSPIMLVVVQSIAVATAGIPAYLLARRWVGDERIAVVFCGVALMYPFIQAQTLFDFHAVTLATPLLLWAIWAAVTHRNVTLGVMVVLAAMTKEQVGLSICIFGIWIIFALGRKRAGSFVALFGLMWSAVIIGAIMPRLRGDAAEEVLLSRYGAFGDSVGAAMKTLIVHPIHSADLLLTTNRVVFVLALFVPLLFLPLRAPLLAAAIIPDLLINLMSNHPQQQQLAFHYGAVAAPFLIAAAIRGLGAMRRSRRSGGRGVTTSPRVVLAVLGVTTIICSYLLSPLPFWGEPPLGRTGGVNRERATQLTVNDPRAPIMLRAVRMIPKDAVVSTGNGFGAHLSARRRVLTFPVVADATWVIVDKKLSAMGDGRDVKAHRERVNRLLLNPRWHVVFDEDSVLVIRRSSGS